MNEKNLLDKMSLNMDYVEAAEYPKAAKYQVTQKRRIIKTAVAAALLLCVSIGYVCVQSKITATADKLFVKDTMIFSNAKIEEKMGVVSIDKAPDEAWDRNYDSLRRDRRFTRNRTFTESPNLQNAISQCNASTLF